MNLIPIKPYKFAELERIIKNDNWYFVCANGGHYHYEHETKPGKVTIPHHSKDIDPVIVRRILRQAGLR